jgi:Protein of unknown function (DUF3037)
MAERKQCEFQLIRYVPDPVKNEFVNIGVLLRGGEQSELRFTRDWARVQCLDPDADTEMLEALEIEIGHRLRAQTVDHSRPVIELLEASLSNGVQITESKGYLAESFPAGLEDLMRLYVDPPRRGRSQRRSGRDALLAAMRTRFEQAGVWNLMRKQIRAADYTEPGDPLRIDCGYSNSKVKFFQAVSLETDAAGAKLLAYSAESLREGLKKVQGAELELTAIIEPFEWPKDDSRPDEERSERYKYAGALMSKHDVRMLTTASLPDIAETARRDLNV